MTPLITRARALAERATKGPWKACRINGTCFVERTEADRAVELIAKRQIEEKERWNEGYNTSEFIAASRDLIPQLCDALELAMKALEQCESHCLCTRNTKGFDYGETHRKLKKPKIGARWLTPFDIATLALQKLRGEG